ncbi:MAG: YebC/PmpR family DNA-binding transcriptional regulator [Candidatus Ancillula sp.]|jgi:YebC/PmpR family DNA-binding regulatory protein|nr:YebC/PmpR family DNA-binding transcriptional regulator [Candidatus Ancillula sp.]
MSGHSKWATTKHKKAANDAKRSKLWAKLVKNIEIAAKQGGADPDGNPSLADALIKARKQSVPKDNIDRAIKRGAGVGGEAVNYEERTYAGMYNGVAILIECLTDNINRANSEVSTALKKNGATQSEVASVQFQFDRKGLIVVPKEAMVEVPGQKKPVAKTADFDELFMVAADAGAENVEEIQGENGDGDLEDQFEVTCAPNDLGAVRDAIKAAGIEYNSADVVWYPNSKTEVDEAAAEKVLNVIDILEELDDVQNVYDNMA